MGGAHDSLDETSKIEMCRAYAARGSPRLYIARAMGCDVGQVNRWLGDTDSDIAARALVQEQKAAIKDILDARVPQLLRRLVDLTDSDDDAVALKAVAIALDRTIGKVVDRAIVATTELPAHIATPRQHLLALLKASGQSEADGDKTDE